MRKKCPRKKANEKTGRGRRIPESKTDWDSKREGVIRSVITETKQRAAGQIKTQKNPLALATWRSRVTSAGVIRRDRVEGKLALRSEEEVMSYSQQV